MINHYYDVVIVGGGAAGLMASIHASKNGASVAIIEHLKDVGKKILSTGNGKCNYTNDIQGVDCYRGLNPDFVVPVFEQFDKDKTVSFFKELGIYPRVKNGYYYPYSEMAVSMVQVLKYAIREAGIAIFTETSIESINYIKNEDDYFEIETNNGSFFAHSIIFATGLLAGRSCGCDGSAFQYIEEAGHTFQDIVPALVQMTSNDAFLKELAGIRAKSGLTLYINGSEIYKDSGEVLFIDKGLSGIVTFQASRYVAYAVKEPKNNIIVSLDLFPEHDKKELVELLYDRLYQFGNNKSVIEAMIGLFPEKLALSLLKKAGIDAKQVCYALSDSNIRSLCTIIKSCEIKVNGTKDYSSAQVCAGGIKTTEINNNTLESLLVPNVYFAGELIDIDGMCGGYNLQWAWSSGFVAGTHAALRSKHD